MDLRNRRAQLLTGLANAYHALFANVSDEEFEEVQKECLATDNFCFSRCECRICETHFYTMKMQSTDQCRYTSVLSRSDAAQLLSDYSRDIFTSQQYLRQTMQQHGEQILQYWRASDRQTRASLLRTLDPAMPQSKGFDAGKTSKTVKQSISRKYLLLPYLDTDTLTKNPEALIGLMRHRTAARPEEWALFDNEQIRRSWAMGLFDLEFDHGAVVMHGSFYGRYATWDADAVHRCDMIGFPRGRLIIEAQATLMNFLRQVMEKLYLASPGAKAGPAVRTFDTRKFNGGWSTMTHQPFNAPPTFDLDAMLALANGRKDASNDHLWLLQTEPSYLRSHVLTLDQMKSAQLVKKEMRSRVAYWELIGELEACQFWQSILLELEQFKSTRQQFNDSMAPGARLPKAVDEHLMVVETLLRARLNPLRFSFLVSTLPQRPQFQSVYKHGKVSLNNAKGTYNPSTDFKFALELSMDRSHRQDTMYGKEKLWWILNQIFQDPDDESRFSHTLLLGLLDDYLANTSPKKRGAFDQILYEKITDYVSLLGLLVEIRMHRPYSSAGNALELKRIVDRKVWRTFQFSSPQHGKANRTSTDPQKAIDALEQFRSTAAPGGPRDKTWLEKFLKLHDRLRDFWREVATLQKSSLQQIKANAEERKFSMQACSHWEAPEYLERLKAKRKSVLSDIATSRTANSGHAFLPLPSTTNSEATRTYAENAAKIKPKTKGTPRTEINVAEVEEALHDLDLTTIPLTKKQSLTTFHAMFPTTPQECKTSIPWNTLVDSMNDAGFLAKNSAGGGSVVKFEDRDGRGSINFHRPHPEPIVEPHVLHAMGWRMSKWFGWHRGSFVLAGK